MRKRLHYGILPLLIISLSIIVYETAVPNTYYNAMQQMDTRHISEFVHEYYYYYKVGELPSSIQSNIPSSPLFIRIIDEKYAIFCSKGYHPIGIGNALGIYWTARATAFFMNWTFIMNDHTNNVTHGLNINCPYSEFDLFNRIKTHLNRGNKWTWFLPMESNKTLFNTQYQYYINKTVIASKFNTIWGKYVNKFQAYAVPYNNGLVWLEYNPWIIPIIQNDTRHAFQLFYQYKGSNALQFYSKTLDDIDTYNVIVVHIRCGDILIHRNRPIYNMDYYKKAFGLIINHINEYGNPNRSYKINIVAQLSIANYHVEKDRLMMNISQIMVYYMAQHFDNYFRTNYDFDFVIDIIGNDTNDNDYFRFVTAPYFIASKSSFCWNGALANYYNPQLLILPNYNKKKEYSYRQKRISDSINFGLLKHLFFIDAEECMAKSANTWHTFNRSSDINNWKNWFITSTCKKSVFDFVTSKLRFHK